MNIKVENEGPCRKKLTIHVPPEKLRSTYDQLLEQYVRNASIPGFRKGRAPRPVIERKYARSLLQDVKERVVPEAYHEAIKSKQIDTVAVLNVSEGELNLAEDFGVTVILDVPPEFKLPNYKNIKLKSEANEVTDADVEQARERILGQFAQYEDVEGRPVKKSDLVRIDFSAALDGRPLSEVDPEASSLESGSDFWMMTDDHAFLPPLAEGLIGARIGDRKQIDCPMPESFHLKSLAGNTIVFDVTVKGMRERRMPELDTALCGRIGVESPEDLDRRIREDLTAQAEQRERMRLRDEICRYLLKHVKMDVPESELQHETRHVLQDMVQEQTRRGIKQEDLTARRDELMETASGSAAERVKLRYILHRIAVEEQIETTDEEMAAYIGTYAARYGMQPEAFREELVKRNALDNIRETLRMNKTLDALLEKARIK